MALSNVSGFPRIGRSRELKFATEGYWRGEKSADELAATAKQIRVENWKLMQERGDRPDPLKRLLLLRPGARRDRPGRRCARALRVEWGPGGPRHLLRDGSRPAERWRRRDRHGDDQVVRHELPLHRPRARPGHQVLAVGLQALRRTRRGDGGGRDRHDPGADRTGQLPAALQARRRRTRPLRPAGSGRVPRRGLRRGDREARRAGCDLGAVRRAVLRRGSDGEGAGCAPARLRGALQGPRAPADPRQDLLRPRRRRLRDPSRPADRGGRPGLHRLASTGRSSARTSTSTVDATTPSSSPTRRGSTTSGSSPASSTGGTSGSTISSTRSTPWRA